jgi:hypothetical protein
MASQKQKKKLKQLWRFADAQSQRGAWGIGLCIRTDSDELTDSRHTKMSYHRDFVPEGCSLAQPAATLGVRLYIFRK